jgi:hypothetical protein
VAGRVRSIEKSNDLIRNETRDLPACSIVPLSTTIPHALPESINVTKNEIYRFSEDIE